MTLKDKFTPHAIERAKGNAMDWLEDNEDGFPRSWAEEEKRDVRWPDFYHPDDEAPVIAGYEALEREGKVVRVGPQVRTGEERIHFKRVTT